MDIYVDISLEELRFHPFLAKEKQYPNHRWAHSHLTNVSAFYAVSSQYYAPRKCFTVYKMDLNPIGVERSLCSIYNMSLNSGHIGNPIKYIFSPPRIKDGFVERIDLFSGVY